MFTIGKKIRKNEFQKNKTVILIIGGDKLYGVVDKKMVFIKMTPNVKHKCKKRVLGIQRVQEGTWREDNIDRICTR